MKKTITFLVSIMASFNSFTQILSIPDANFKAVLVADPFINTNGDAEIQLSEANAYTGNINVSYSSISDLTGIASFINLNDLNCIGNQLTSLDISSNTALTGLSCASNQLSNLNISANTALAYLYCSQNQIASLDVSTNTALTNLTCNVNQLTSLDISANTALTHLNCMFNQITSLDANANTSLIYLYCNNNKLNTINLSGATALIYLQCGGNSGYTTLDVSGATALNTLNCTNSANLHCIQVANVAAANANPDWHKDTIASYSTQCATAVSNTVPATFTVYPIPADNTLHIAGLRKDDEWQLYNIYGQLLLAGKCSNEYNKSVDIHRLDNGIYTIQFTRNNAKYIRKFLKASFY